MLQEAVGWKGSEENRKFIQAIALPRAEGMEFVKTLETIANQLHDLEVEKRKLLNKPSRFGRAPIKYTEEGGEMIFRFQRREADGPPLVIKADGTVSKAPIAKNTGVKIAYDAVPYVMNDVFGISLKMLGIKTSTITMTVEQALDLFDDEPVVPTSKPVATKKEDTDISDLF
jgi:hypothetical protein